MAPYSRHETGKTAESLAREFLEGKGMMLLEQNYRCFHGEIDIIMQDKNDIVFVEVRSRNRTDYGNAFDSVTPLKIRKLMKSATHYLQRKQWLHTRRSRFDLVGFHPIEGEMRMQWIKGAF